jgi:hypothetical protein
MPQLGTGLMKLAYLLTKFLDMIIGQAIGQPVQNAGWVIEHHPGIAFGLFVFVDVNPVIFQQRFGQQVFKRIKQVIR